MRYVNSCSHIYVNTRCVTTQYKMYHCGILSSLIMVKYESPYFNLTRFWGLLVMEYYKRSNCTKDKTNCWSQLALNIFHYSLLLDSNQNKRIIKTNIIPYNLYISTCIYSQLALKRFPDSLLLERNKDNKDSK